MDEHKRLLKLVRRLPQDYTPFGDDPRKRGNRFGPDCSGGCRWYRPLDGPLGADWGVCTNPKSHRCGLLTFEHQGCWAFEAFRKSDLDNPAVAEWAAEYTHPRLTRLLRGKP